MKKVIAILMLVITSANAMVQTGGTGHFTIPTAPAAGTSVTSGAANTFTTTYVQLTASTGAAAIYITGLYLETAAVSAATYRVIQLATGAAASEVVVDQELFAPDTQSTVTLTYRPIYPPIPVANATRIAVKSADSVGSLATLVTLECINQSNVIAATTESANVLQWNTTNVSSPATAGIPDVNVKNINNVGASTPGASGGILISGSNSGTTTLAALTVTGTTTMSDGLVVSRSTSNSSAISATGSGSGHGIIATGGAAAGLAGGGSGFKGVGGAASTAGGNSAGRGLWLLGGAGAASGNPGGSGLEATGGNSAGTTAAGAGIQATGGTASSSSGGTANSGLLALGGSGASSTNGAGSGITAQGGGTTTVSGGIGLQAVGTSAAADISAATNGTTTNITGNLSGSVGSVTGAVGSVTGAVGSVTGNVGGNVVGSVGSVTAAVTLPSIPSNWITSAGINASALNGKGDWLLSSSYRTSAQEATAIWADTVAGDFTTALSIGKSVMNGVTLGTGLTVNAVTGLTASNLDTTVSSRMATYTQPTGFLSATFPSGTIANTTNITAGTITTATNLTTNNDKTGYSISGTKTTLDALNDITAGAPWDVAIAGHLTAGTTGFALNAAGSAGDPWSTSLPGSYGAGTAGFIVGTNLNATVSSRSTYSGTDTSGTTTLLTRIPSALTITTGKVDVNDKTGFSLISAYDPAKTAAQAGNAMTLTSAYDAAKTAATQASVNAIPTNPLTTLGTNAPSGWINAASIGASAMNGKGDWLLSSSYVAPDNASITTIKGVTNNLGTMLENVGGERFTIHALMQGPSGGGSVDPLATHLPGSYTPDQAGYLIYRAAIKP